MVDRTGLNGAWNFTFKWSIRTPRVAAPAGAGETIGLFDALEKQLGLKLELTSIATPVVVVDRVNEKHTDNAPGVAARFPAPPLEFEVADIKPADPESRDRGASVNIQKGGRVSIVMTLRNLIQEAWGDFNSELIVGGPKPSETTAFIVTAKAPAPELKDGPAVWNGVDIDSMRMMLRKLLIDRFKLVAHEEERLVPGYALVAAKPKLRRADPANRPSCNEGPGPDGKDPRLANPMASRLVTCRNMTLAQFAKQLPEVAGPFLTRFVEPVPDATGIEGRYDLTINFSPWQAFRNAAKPPSGDDGTASEPNGAISIFDALDRQLGLKLEPRKVKATVLVIDSVNEFPSEN